MEYKIFLNSLIVLFIKDKYSKYIYNVKKDSCLKSILLFLIIRESWNIKCIMVSRKILGSTTGFYIDSN